MGRIHDAIKIVESAQGRFALHSLIAWAIIYLALTIEAVKGESDE